MKVEYKDFKIKVVICRPDCHNFEMWKLLLILVVIKYNMLVFENARFTPQRFKIKYRILEYFNQTLHLIGGIMQGLGPHRILGPRRVLDPHRILGPPRVLGSHSILCPPRVLGPPRILGLHRVLASPRVLGPHWILDPPRVVGPPKILGPHRIPGPPRVLDPGFSEGPGSRFSVMPIDLHYNHRIKHLL